MSIRGKWRIVETPGFDMAAPSSYLLFEENGGAFVIDCLTGSIHFACEGDVVEWSGNNEMDEASGEGWAELQEDGTLQGEINLQNGDDVPFIARR